MKISKEEALALAKLLHANGVGGPSIVSDDAKSDHDRTLEDLAERFDEFLLYGDEEDEECEHDCCVDEGEGDDDEGEEDLGEEEEDSGEEDEEDDEESGEDEESSEEDDGDDSEDEEEELDADSYAAGSDLHELKAAPGPVGSVEFEFVTEDDYSEEDHVDLVLDGYTEVEDVTHVRRKGKELHVRDGHGNWRVFNVSKFPKGWADILPLNELVEVEA